MITVKCELKDKNLYSLLDDEFEKTAGMKKIGEGQYEGDSSEILCASYFSIKRLFSNDEFVKQVKSFTRTVGREEEDILEYFDSLKNPHKYRKNKHVPKSMITINCELKDESLYSLLDEEFENTAGMKKIGKGQYEGDGNQILHTSYLAVNRLLSINGFLDRVKSFTRKVGNEVEDVFQYYDYLLKRGKLDGRYKKSIKL